MLFVLQVPARHYRPKRLLKGHLGTFGEVSCQKELQLSNLAELWTSCVETEVGGCCCDKPWSHRWTLAIRDPVKLKKESHQVSWACGTLEAADGHRREKGNAPRAIAESEKLGVGRLWRGHGEQLGGGSCRLSCSSEREKGAPLTVFKLGMIFCLPRLWTG